MDPFSSIQIKGLVKRFNHQTILKGVDFLAEPGELVALFGKNGSGKTTFLRILATLSNPTQGNVCVAGFPLPKNGIEARRHIGYVSHHVMLYNHLTVWENLQYYAYLFAIHNAEKQISQCLALVGMSSHQNVRIGILSRGMLQRLTIARAILHNPSILLLDEPHSHLDQEMCQVLDHLLCSMISQEKTIILASHNLDRVSTIAQRFVVLQEGKLKTGAPNEFIKQNNAENAKNP